MPHAPSPLTHAVTTGLARRRPAFSLVELLVVLGIIALLIGILLPVLSTARKTGHAVVCSSNLRQLGLMAFTFTADHYDAVPANRIFADRSGAAPYHISWRAWLIELGYVDDQTAWTCPDEAPFGPRTELGRTIHGSTCIDDVETNYAYNGSAFWGYGAISHKAGTDRTLAEVHRPSELIFMLETQGPWPDLGDWMLNQNAGGQGGYAGYWHPSGTSNWLMVDGSGASAKAIDMVDPSTKYHNTRHAKALADLSPADLEGVPHPPVALDAVLDIYR
jgi:prepilin-type N-terminal cleavage/methylation domain-containing protein